MSRRTLGPDVPWSDPTPWLRVAVHESGHAVFARLMGWPIARVAVKREPDPVIGERVGVVQLALPKRSATPVERTADEIEVNARWELSGPVAEALLTGRGFDLQDRETRRAMDMLLALHGDQRGPLAFFTAWQCVWEVLGYPPRWAAIERLALHLCYFPVLTGHRAAELIDNAVESRQREQRFFTNGTASRRACIAAGVPTLRDRLEGVVGPKATPDELLNSTRIQRMMAS